MKVGKLAEKLVRRALAKRDRKAMKTWPDKAPYRPLLDVDALHDAEFYHQLDVYHAPESVRKHRTVIMVHGGAYLLGSRKGSFRFAIYFLKRGYDVVCLDYEHNDGKRGCLDQLMVLAAQIRYVVAASEELDVNADDMVLVGDSAGGHFALLLAELSCDLSFQQESGILLGGASFRGAVLHCPVYDLVRSTHSPVMSKSGLKYMFGPHYDDDEYHALLSPKVHLDSLKIPVFVSSCTNDFLKQETLDLKADCDHAGKPLTYLFIESDKREVAHVHNVISPELPETDKVNNAAIDFLDGLLY